MSRRPRNGLRAVRPQWIVDNLCRSYLDEKHTTSKTMRYLLRAREAGIAFKTLAFTIAERLLGDDTLAERAERIEVALRQRVAEFFERLKRARGSGSKAQYLRIQALHLQQVGEPACLRAALELLQLMVADYPEAIQLAQAHKQRAECLIAVGERDSGLLAYRDSLD